MQDGGHPVTIFEFSSICKGLVTSAQARERSRKFVPYGLFSGFWMSSVRFESDQVPAKASRFASSSSHSSSAAASSDRARSALAVARSKALRSRV